MDHELSFNHVVGLRDLFHRWVQEALNVKTLSKEDRENICVVRDAFEASFFDILEFTSNDTSGRLGGIVARIMLTSSALGQLIPSAPIQKRILDSKRQSDNGKERAKSKSAWRSSQDGKELAIMLRSKNPTLSQGELADKMIKHWADSKKPPYCGRDQLIKIISVWQKDKENPLPTAKRC